MEGQSKYTVITGASSGIGRAAAKAFAKRGKNVLITARRRGMLESLKAEILNETPGVDVKIAALDCSIARNVYQFYQDVKPFTVETWINNAGFGNYSSVAQQDLEKIQQMLHLNIEALTIFSSLYIRDYWDMQGAQLINLSSAGGYTIVPNAVTYCATKFYVSAFTEGLAHELKAAGAKCRAKLLAPAATKTGFGETASGAGGYDYDAQFSRYHTSDEMAGFLLKLYDSDAAVGRVNRDTFAFQLSDPVFPYAGTPLYQEAADGDKTKW